MARFTRTDWLELATRLLAEEGPGALVIERLTEAAGRTRGSFYHHFESRDAFLGALMEHWRVQTIEEASKPYHENPDPKAWRALIREAPHTLNHPFERALRRLAASEPIVQAGVKRVDEERIASLAFLIGFLQPEVEDPQSRAFIQYAVVVGGQWLLDSEDDPRMPALRKVGAALFGLEED